MTSCYSTDDTMTHNLDHYRWWWEAQSLDLHGSPLCTYHSVSLLSRRGDFLPLRTVASGTGNTACSLGSEKDQCEMDHHIQSTAVHSDLQSWVVCLQDVFLGLTDFLQHAYHSLQSRVVWGIGLL